MQPPSIHVSIGTAAVLGLARLPLADPPTTAYLMLGGRCLMDCAFCAQARHSLEPEGPAASRHLSRVTWPKYPLETVVDHLADAAAGGIVRRACLQVTVTAEAFAYTLATLQAVKARSEVPFDVAILPQTLDEVRRLLQAGADHIGFGLDAAGERVYRRVKGGSWARNVGLIEQAARAFPGRLALHLIVGLGETEREMVGRIQWAHDLGIIVGLFAFTPLRGTHLADRPPPPLDVYRRMQAARWLIVHGLARFEEMSFDPRSRLAGPGASSWQGLLPVDGEPFRTSGCPDCNRPYYNERPGGVIYNYPRPLSAQEAARAVQEMQWDLSRQEREE